MILSQKQKELIEIAEGKGYITHTDMIGVYSTPKVRKANLHRFMALGILKQDPEQGDSFILNKERLEELK